MKLLVDIANPDAPDDVSGLARFLHGIETGAIEQLFVFGKTEGDATLTDTSRQRALAATEAAIRDAGGAALLERSWRLFSTGCEGIATPVCATLAQMRGQDSDSGPTGLAVGAARSSPIPDPLRCGPAHIEAAAATVRDAMNSAGLAPAQVTLVLLKSPIRMGDGGRLGRHARSTGSSRGAAALGSAVALGEWTLAGDDPVANVQAHASRTMAFSGTETDAIEAIVFGMRPGGDPDFAMSNAVLSDLMDLDAAHSVAQPRGFGSALVFFKAGISHDGRLRGRRTTVLTSELPADKQLRAAASGLVGAAFGPVDAFVSGGAEHQGPVGSCLCTVLWRRQAPETGN